MYAAALTIWFIMSGVLFALGGYHYAQDDYVTSVGLWAFTVMWDAYLVWLVADARKW